MRTFLKIDKISLTIFLSIYCPVCMAYIDPGTGSLLIQGLIAGVAAGMYALKLYWYKFKNIFSPKKDDSKDSNTESSEVNDSE